jgi:hypothetical protein
MASYMRGMVSWYDQMGYTAGVLVNIYFLISPNTKQEGMCARITLGSILSNIVL